MKKFSLCFFTSILFLLSCGPSDTPTSISYEDTGTLFQLLNPQKTGVEFSNRVADENDYNIINYRNFYNGGGVAIGDVDKDGLPDLYFTSNKEANRLYRNLGNWKFEDITESARVGGTRAWSTGVSMVDINADGWLDIYVCNSGNIEGESKENELFINQQDGTFAEAAAQWGLNNPGFSTHASFFDYDGDGDLDCYILNNSFRSPNRVELYKKTREEVDEEGGDRLLRNEGNTFMDVTTELGIFTSDIGFGLGVSVSDLNGDMLPDIYVANDFWERDYLYINQGEGRFSEELTQRTDRISLSSMGADLADLNNDGSPEVICTEMLPGDNMRLKTMAQFNSVHIENRKFLASYHHQYLQNSLQVNDGQGNFVEQANMSGIAATDWSWGALAFDFQGDGLKDLFISNGIQRDITNLDFVDFITDKEAIKEIVEKTGRADLQDYLPYLSYTPLSNYGFVNQGQLRFQDLADSLGLATPSFSNGAAYGDLDGDGDLDLVVNNVNMPAFLYQNKSEALTANTVLSIKLVGPEKNPLGIGAKVQVFVGDKMQELQHYTTRGFQSSVAPGLVFGLGKQTSLDSLRVIWPDLKTQLIQNPSFDTPLILSHADAQATYSTTPIPLSPLFSPLPAQTLPGEALHVENSFNDFDQERLLPRGISSEGPRIVKGDVNGDGKEDFILLGSENQPNQLFLQTRTGFSYTNVPAFETHKNQEATCGLLFDYDGDGDLDFIVGHGGNDYRKGFESYKLRLYENKGKAQFAYREDRTPSLGGNFSVITAADIEEDGDLDLFVGGRIIPGNYGMTPGSYLLVNEGAQGWRNGTTEMIGTLGMVTDALWDDVNGDARPDLVVVGEWMPVTILFNTGEDLEKQEVAHTRGWWTRIKKADLNSDGESDYILGNWGTNTKFKASPEKPLSLYVKDFDSNGKNEFILNWYPPLEEKAYPFPAKGELIEQLPPLKKKILKYEQYGAMTYEDLFTPEEREGALSYTTERLHSSILYKDNAGWRLENLPDAAQVSPIYGIAHADFNEDGHWDLFLGGNLYDLKPEVGRADGNKGVVLLGNGQGQWEVMSAQQSGIRINGEVRDIQVFQIGGKKRVLVARNNDSVLGFEW